MKMRKIERCNMIVSEIGLGCEGFHEADMDLYQLLDIAETSGVNCIDLYSPDPIMRKRLGEALKGRREKFIIQGHLCSVWKNNQYERTRNLEETKAGLLKK